MTNAIICEENPAAVANPYTAPILPANPQAVNAINADSPPQAVEAAGQFLSLSMPVTAHPHDEARL
jgi:hypothetical protein